MESFRIELEACDPARGCFRAYRIEAGTDLLGDWLVDVILAFAVTGSMAASAPRTGVSATSPAAKWKALSGEIPGNEFGSIPRTPPIVTRSQEGPSIAKARSLAQVSRSPTPMAPPERRSWA
jgi:hypothetical protein